MSRKRGDKWQGLVKVRGQQFSATFDTEKEAKAWEERERLKYADTTFSRKLGVSKVNTVAELWLEIRKDEVAESTHSTDKMVIGQLPSRLLNRQMRGIKPQDVQLILDGWRRSKSPATVRRYCDTLGAFFRWAAQRGYVPMNPMDGVEAPKRKHKVHQISPLTEAEVEEIALEIGGFNAEVVLFLAYTGLRWGEARALRVGDVQLKEQPPRIQVRRSQPEGAKEKSPKSGRMRIVPIAQRLLPIVEKLAVGRGRDAYLISRDGRSQIWRGRFVRSTSWPQISAGRTIHDLRHSAACNWLRRGVPVNTVQAWLGHADLETTAIYTTYLGMGIDLGAYEKMNNG
ncbi:tyrosine-type recombinase/integrase [Corynebacterium lowii]|uniref:Tyrosine recombinase XerC n=1 Tax=Corynebacterium lowii TaxID=1544413 RepID=A0A0Q0YXW6_9CORY|nr:tyrosine-type recombinase/integrase [Corynebacterium lowii]KQB87213.1 Tyrosine recombinase XerC [Corynebacterium lowii]MDP9852200.1 integrase [Corynebacterium lowii]